MTAEDHQVRHCRNSWKGARRQSCSTSRDLARRTQLGSHAAVESGGSLDVAAAVADGDGASRLMKPEMGLMVGAEEEVGLPEPLLGECALVRLTLTGWS